MTRTYLHGHRFGRHVLSTGYSSRWNNSAVEILRGQHSCYAYRPKSPTSPATWLVRHNFSLNTCHSPREVREYVATLIERDRIAAERESQGRLWDSLCAAQAARAKTIRTARNVLAIAACRQLVAAIGGRKYSTDLDYYCTRKVQAEAKSIWLAREQRRADRKIAEGARTPVAGRMFAVLADLRQRREKAKADRDRKALLAGKLGRKALAELIAGGKHLHAVGAEADALVRCTVRAVGTIGEQAERDLTEMRTDEDFAGKCGRHHKREQTTVERVEHLRDWSAALVTMRDYASFGSHRMGGGNGYGSVGGSKFRCYLVVRDTTSGEAHVLRVAPKFGNSDTQFFGRFRSPAERIEAARASTFVGVGPEVLAAAMES